MKKTIKLYSLLLISLPFLFSCVSDYLDTMPTGTTPSGVIFADVKGGKMAINGMARLMVNQYNSSSGFGQYFSGEGTIKFVHGEYYGEHSSRPSSSTPRGIASWKYMDNNTADFNRFAWYYYYALIGNANELLANIGGMEGTESEVNFIKAQALFYRAYSYSQLIQFYCTRWADNKNDEAKLNNGLILRTVENMNETYLPLSSAKTVYAQVYADLDEAIALFSNSTETRGDFWEPNINVAYAAYARAALTCQDYSKAVEMAIKAREGYPLMSNAEYKSGFSESNDEWIWGSFGGDIQTLHYYGFHSHMSYDATTSAVRSHPIAISKELYLKIPTTDIRYGMVLNSDAGGYSTSTGLYAAAHAVAKQVLADHPTMDTHRVVAYHVFKFSIGGSRGVGCINHFRSSEMYLIEAEAKYYLGGAEADVRSLMNALIRDSKRDEAYECTASGADLLSEIKMYRAIELWGEGFDFLDKKRYNEPLVRKSFTNGGNFHAELDGTFDTNYKNSWTYVTPLYESENNPNIGGGN